MNGTDGRFQFSIADLFRCALFAALACGLFRMALGWHGDDWVPPMLDALAIISTGASLGSLWRRARFGVFAGFAIGAIWIAVATIGPLFTLFCLAFLAACVMLL